MKVQEKAGSFKPSNLAHQQSLSLSFLFFGSPALEAPIRPNGTFLIENVQPGDYKLAVSPQWKHYIKAARLDGNDVLNGVQISAAPSEGLEVVLGSDTAHVEGTIVDGDHKPVTGVEVVLIPAREAKAATYTERQLQINVAVSRSFRPCPGNTNSSPGKILRDSRTWIPTFSANTKNWERP